jgi:hypothetical protein
MRHATLLLSLSLLLAPLVRADEASHRAAAEKLVEVTDTSRRLQETLPTVLAPMIDNMKRQGLSAELTEEVKTVVTKWFQTEIKWEDIRPQIVELYAKEYSEAELNELLKFFASDSGKKFPEKMPTVMQSSMKIVQTYFQGKQASLQTALTPVIEKARAASGNK